MADRKSVYYWDSCIWYEHLNREMVSPLQRQGLREILADNVAQENLIVTSVITHLEVLPEKLTGTDAIKEKMYFDQFDGVHMRTEQVSDNVLRLAREIRSFYFRSPPQGGGYAKIMDLGDAIHLATAALLNVDEFHTRDDSDAKTKIPLVSLYKWSGVSTLCGRYPLKIVSPEAAQGSFLDG